MSENMSSLRRNISMLGSILGNVIKHDKGSAFFNKLETIRSLSKSARNQSNIEDKQTLLKLLNELPDTEITPFTRAFNHFLNLSNIAEQFHSVSQTTHQDPNESNHFFHLLQRLKSKGFSNQLIAASVSQLNIEIVLTAHPTEVTRRTLIQKHEKIFQCLYELDNHSLIENEKIQIEHRLRQLITEAWHTYEFRTERPSPIEEAKGSFATIEHSLWDAIPLHLRKMDKMLEETTGYKLPIDSTPIRLSSWIGGDRDGNPFVTANITKEVLLLSRWMVIDLYLRDIKLLINELSLNKCNDELRALVGDTREPYWVILKALRTKLRDAKAWCEHALRTLKTSGSLISDTNFININELIQPLTLCYRSLQQSGLQLIANASLLDMIRRAHCFGLILSKLDIRQEASRHTKLLSEITIALDIGDFSSWNEEKKQAFLLQELKNSRPLVPRNWTPSKESQEVIDTFRVIASQGQNYFNCYVISMAKNASDVLTVILLLAEYGVNFNLPITPLFETLNDLNNAKSCMKQLIQIPWYQEYCQNKQMVMIGYSDSAKDAGWMSAAWAQYQAMDNLTKLCVNSDIQLTLFHGRGGTIGRGGGPAHSAILSQPPGSVNFRLRITEQGEMIRFKFGFPAIAVHNLMIYTSATLEASLLPPIEPKKDWLDIMDQIAKDCCTSYRSTIHENSKFIPYFQSVTPEKELAKLPLGSRPAKRNPSGGIESLRAIPWIFSWTQNRLMLPTWLGFNSGMQQAINNGKKEFLKDMLNNWPFFKARLEMLEMVFVKTDEQIFQYYSQQLVPKSLKYLSDELLDMLRAAINIVIDLNQNTDLMSSHPIIKQAINLRNPYIDPLNFLQAELLHRVRQETKQNPELEQALMITVAGIAAGIRNTG